MIPKCSNIGSPFGATHLVPALVASGVTVCLLLIMQGCSATTSSANRVEDEQPPNNKGDSKNRERGAEQHAHSLPGQNRDIPSTHSPGSFSKLVADLLPTVVNIATAHDVPIREPVPWPGPEEPPDAFFDRFFDEEEGYLRTRSLGSGVIIDRAGYIATNQHVVAQADEITVILGDDQSYPAVVIGTDTITDLALLRIEPDIELSAAVWGETEEIFVGDWVLAIGNPFGLGQTVTAGIVSAKGRVIGAGPYDNFIQTDTAINPGNSGGPIFDINGQMVGITTAMVAVGQGIGFAVPADMAKPILQTLREEGKVTRGWLGVVVQKVTVELAETFGLDEPRGALVAEVAGSSPAQRANLQPGDIILSLNGREIRSVDNLQAMVAEQAPGSDAVLQIYREGRQIEVRVTLGILPTPEATQSPASSRSPKRERGSGAGLKLAPLSEALQLKLGVTGKIGALVTEVEPGSPADLSGLKQGDVVLEANKRPVTCYKKLGELVGNLNPKDRLLLKLKRGGANLFLVLKSR